MDIKDKQSRSKNMAAIKSEDTKPEIFLRKKLFAEGYRYRIYDRRFPGKPDLYFAKYKTAVFVNGCFWHRHTNCKFAYTPKSNVDFWNKKFESNISRDLRQKQQLMQMNLRILVVWECTIKRMKKDQEFSDLVLNEIKEFLVSGTQSYKEL